MKRPLDQLAEIAQEAVGIGTQLIKRSRPKTVTEKVDRDTYTDVDVQIERAVRAYLAEATPDIGFIGEEEGRSVSISNENRYWTLDPIDGTANYVHGLPLCAVQIALIIDETTTVAAIDLPYMDSRYIATLGHGSYVNGTRMRISGTTSLSKSIVSIGDYATGSDSESRNRPRFKLTSELAQKVERIRMFGSAAHDLVWMAEGKTDATVILSNNILDIAPGALIAREAGARVGDTDNDEYSTKSPNIIAATPGVYSDIARLVTTSLRYFDINTSDENVPPL
ncbi:inositol monophosphatase family protein [Actinosynnema sp. NPDC051121]